jgi:hypothetical protein
MREQLIGFLEERSHIRPIRAAVNDGTSPPSNRNLPPARRPRLQRFLSALTPA